MERRSSYMVLLMVLTLGTVHAMVNRLGLIETNLGESASDCTQVQVECRDKFTSGSPVCGNDGITYNDLCMLREVICRDRNVQFKHDGECLSNERCLSQRAKARQERNSKNGVYIPQCEENGSFQATQCHQDTGYCWCVTPGGETTGQYANGKDILQLNCNERGGGRKGGYKTTGGTATRPTCPPNSNLKRCNPSKDSCSASRRIVFLENMVALFHTEYMRYLEYMNLTQVEDKPGAIVWKFLQLDRNNDSSLGRNEYRHLKKIVRKNVEPKSCAKDFPLLCDNSGNNRVTLQEWTLCWNLDPGANILMTHTPKPNNLKRGNKQGRRKGGAKSRNRKRKIHKYPRNRIIRNSTCTKERERELNNAHGARKDTFFVPVCDAKGRYKPYQCFGSEENDAWFCWCVNVYTGQQLEGTSTKSKRNGSLNCNAMNLPTKQWTRCRKKGDKQRFLTALKSHFKNVLGYRNGYTDEEAITKMFDKLDTNGNNKLNRNEIKLLQKKLVSNRAMKRCGRYMHRVCDANDDKAIYSKEWRNCLLEPQKNPKSNQRSGMNPFIDILTAEETK